MLSHTRGYVSYRATGCDILNKKSFANSEVDGGKKMICPAAGRGDGVRHKSCSLEDVRQTRF